MQFVRKFEKELRRSFFAVTISSTASTQTTESFVFLKMSYFATIDTSNRERILRRRVRCILAM